MRLHTVFSKFDHFGLRSIAVRRNYHARASILEFRPVRRHDEKKNIGRAARRWIGIAHVFRESQKSEVFSTRISSKSLIVDRVNPTVFSPKEPFATIESKTNHKLDYH